MLADDNEQQQQSPDPLYRITTDLANVGFTRDQLSEIIATMTKTLHMNTPEQTMNGIDIDDFDNYNERNLSKNQHLIEQLQAQLVHNQMRRTQARNYLRILGQSNTPAYWYKAPPVSRSVYYYDPNYQKYVQRRSNPFQKTNLNVPSITPQSIRTQGHPINHPSLVPHSSFPLTPRTKYMLDLCTTATSYHQQRQRANQNYHSTSPNVSQQHLSTSSRLQSIPTLPFINTSKQRNNQLSNTNQKRIIPESKKKI